MSLNPEFLHELKQHFTGDLRFDAISRTLYSTDASMYQIKPLGVAIPKTQDDLQSAVELAAKYRVPILARGAGSSLCGQAIGEALILDCSRHLDSIIAIDKDARTATVEPGVVLADLNRAAAKVGLMFGPDPASAERATMGGVVGNNATGAHSILYGMTADHLISADVILADGGLAVWGAMDEERGLKKEGGVYGDVISAVMKIRGNYAEAIKQSYPRSWRNSAGYRLNYLLPWSPSTPSHWYRTGSYPPVNDPSASGKTFNLAALLSGSEGTLAVMRSAKINLVPKPRHTILGMLVYDSIAAACDDVPRLLEFKPSAIELIPRMIIQLARGIPAYARQMGWMTGDPAAVLVIEFSGDQPSVLSEALRKVGELFITAESAEEQTRVWNIRKMGLGILDSRQQSARPAAFIEDCAVPVERLGEFVREVERILQAHDAEGGIYAHASAGCLHIRPILNLQKGQGVRALRSIGDRVLSLVLSLGGSMSSEHGDGIVAGEWIEKTYGPKVTEAMRLVKDAADPHHILNPKIMLDAPPMDSHLRYGENYRVKIWDASLHFEHEQGLAGAIEHCNGQGVCRKTTGVMCPSFQATREEQNSTRGRSNLLRALMVNGVDNRETGALDAAFSALDLCLACKGCTSECPSGVDMPRLKYEFMHEYFKTHRRPMRDYLFGYFHLVSKWLSPVAPLANVFMKMNWSHRLIAGALGITDKRPFPLFSGSQADGDNSVRHGKAAGKRVIFLSDVFSRYLEPQVERAAFGILHAAGYEVLILPVIGAGASLLSKGFIESARSHAGRVLDEIAVLDGGAGLSVIGCEPPEMYCIKHEYTALLPGRRKEIEGIVKRTWLMDEFVVRSGLIDEIRVANKAQILSQDTDQKRVTFHPHCHQRAEGLADDGLPIGTAATLSMLRSFGFDVEVVESGCCGMAGTFGYDAEHYELSMQVGELKLFPALRQSSNAVIASSGSACRLQIKQGTDKTAKHPLELLAELIKPERSSG